MNNTKLLICFTMLCAAVGVVVASDSNSFRQYIEANAEIAIKWKRESVKRRPTAEPTLVQFAREIPASRWLWAVDQLKYESYDKVSCALYETIFKTIEKKPICRPDLQYYVVRAVHNTSLSGFFVVDLDDDGILSVAYVAIGRGVLGATALVIAVDKNIVGVQLSEGSI